jgi:hypothetical protein
VVKFRGEMYLQKEYVQAKYIQVKQNIYNMYSHTRRKIYTITPKENIYKGKIITREKSD